MTDKATPTPASVDSVMAKAMMLVGALGDSCEAVTSLPFLEAVTALREEVERLAQAAPTGLTDMGWVIDAANEGELAAYDQGCAECQQAVAKILDGKDTGDGTANPPWELLRRRLIALVAAQPSQAPVVQAVPVKCPITRRPFFMVIEHPELGWVPTYGGPYDSYTIPHMEGKPDEPFHERGLTCHHFDHDAGYWLDDETIPMRVINKQVLNDLLSAAPQPQQEQQGWRPIETAPKDEATYFLATNGSGVWVAHWQPVAGSGYRFDNPWRTVMLNHWHIEDKQRRYDPPTHWMPLPSTPPKD